MKVNCDRLSDWLKTRKSARDLKRLRRKEAKQQWRNKFVIYHRFGHGDCRLFETIQCRNVERYRVQHYRYDSIFRNCSTHSDALYWLKLYGREYIIKTFGAKEYRPMPTS